MSSTKNYDLDIDTTLGGSNASDYIIPSQKAIKSYTDNAISGASSIYQLIAQNMNTLAQSGTIALTDNSVNKTNTLLGNVVFTLPTITDYTKLHQIFVQIQQGSTVRSIDLGTTRYFNSTAPDLSEASKAYNIYWEFDNVTGYWVVGCIDKGTAT